MAIRIPLRAQDGSVRGYAIADDADSAQAVHRWCLDTSTGYAVRTIYLGMVGGKQRQRKVYLHREILGLTVGDGREADHINGVRTDCQRSNLRVGTHSDNVQNVPAQGGTSRHRGVSWQPRATGGKWAAKGRVGGRQRHVGYFDSEAEAAEAMAAFRREHMPYSNEDRSVACP